MPQFTIGQLPWNKQASLAANVHARKTGIPSRNDAVCTYRKGGSAAMIFRRVELLSIRGKPARVAHRIKLVRCRQVAGTRLCVYVFQRVSSAHQAMRRRNILRQGSRGRCRLCSVSVHGRRRRGGLRSGDSPERSACEERKEWRQ